MPHPEMHDRSVDKAEPTSDLHLRAGEQESSTDAAGAGPCPVAMDPTGADGWRLSRARRRATILAVVYLAVLSVSLWLFH